MRAGVSDYEIELPLHPEMEPELLSKLIPDYATRGKQALRERSVTNWLDQVPLKLPVLLLYGDADTNVSVQNSIRLAAKLKQRGQVHKLVVYPEGDHGLYDHMEEVEAELVQWFKKYL